jgi:hypothetical protein
MTSANLIKFIMESRKLIKDATPDQKIKFIKLVLESYKKIRDAEQPKIKVLNEQNLDYLSEK